MTRSSPTSPSPTSAAIRSTATALASSHAPSNQLDWHKGQPRRNQAAMGLELTLRGQSAGEIVVKNGGQQLDDGDSLGCGGGL
ncbi:hypothetical protein ACIPYS_07845 [Kitasatospora sp. NPDC089913]|uniref:hypothetical protein n=1 Tax=Kitasatospora sp. NPDC089913 TaxID=3364080 RepID=UPI003803BE33